MKNLAKIITFTLLASLIAATIIFALSQIRRSKSIDESLVSSLAAQLDVVSIQQAIDKLNPNESPEI